MGFFQEVIFLRKMLTVQVEMRCTSCETSFKYYSNLLNWINREAALSPSLCLYWITVGIYNAISLPKPAAFYTHSKYQKGQHHQPLRTRVFHTEVWNSLWVHFRQLLFSVDVILQLNGNCTVQIILTFKCCS